MNIFKSRKFRQGTVATVLSVVGVALIILLTSVLSILSERMDVKLDMTENQIFAISDETKEYMESLQKDVNIYVLNTEDNFKGSSPVQYFTQANEVIKAYQNMSGHVKVQYVSIVQDPTFASRYSNLDLQTNNVLVESNGRTVQLSYKELFNTQTQFDQSTYQSYTRVLSSKAEQAMTSAILTVTSDKQIKVQVITGHGESDVTAFTDLLKMNGYEISDVDLIGEELAADTDIAILAAPARDLTEDELKKLDAFLYNDNQLGKNLFYMASYEQPASTQMPNLTAFLEEWGFKVGDSVVFEADSRRLISTMSLYMFRAGYAESDYQPDIKTTEAYPAIVYSRPVELLWEAKNGKTTSALLESSAQSGLYPMDAGENWQPTEDDLVGPIPVFAISQNVRYDNLTPLSSSLMVLGSVEAMDSSFLGETSFTNSEYFLALLDKLVGREESIRLEDKTISNQSLNASASQVYGIGIAVAIVLPVILIIVGLIVFIRRRHR